MTPKPTLAALYERLAREKADLERRIYKRVYKRLATPNEEAGLPPSPMDTRPIVITWTSDLPADYNDGSEADNE